MTYTLKVDWNGYRTLAVRNVLRSSPYKRSLARLCGTLDLYFDPQRPDEVSTVKLDVPDKVLDTVDDVLSHWLRVTSPDLAFRARDNEPELDYQDIAHTQAQVFAALQDIRQYREAAAGAAVLLAQNREDKA